MFGRPEGLGLPVLEALAAGALVVGDHGGGGRAFLRAPWGWPVPVNEPVRFARTAAAVLQALAEDPHCYDATRAAARAWVCRHYGLDRAQRSRQQVWSAIRRSWAARSA